MYRQNNSWPKELKIGNIYISFNTIHKAILALLLLLPENVFAFITLYSSTTPSYISYKWLDYKFGIIQLIILILGALLLFSNRNRLVPALLVLFFIRELIFPIFTNNNIFSQHSFEIYLTLFVGIAFIVLVNETCYSLDELEDLFILIIFLNILTLYPRVVLHLNGILGRYNISNLDVGMTGTFCGIAFIYSVFNNNLKYRIFWSIVSVMGIFLSGSRVNMLIFVAVLLTGILISLFRDKKINRRQLIFGTIIFIVVMLILLSVIIYMNFAGAWNDFVESIFNSRMLSTFNNSEMKTDSSFLGRTTSIGIGLDIVKENPFGISGYFINLQEQTRQRGFATFPHSSMLDTYILFGPIVIALIVYIIRNLIKIFKISFTWFLVLLYMFVFVCISGGPIVNFKIVFFYGMILYITSKKIKLNELETQETE
ncbi:MAG: O-antigen ligase family protein [Lachnospiraceae bacterium]